MEGNINSSSNYFNDINRYLLEEFELSQEQLDEMLPLFIDTVRIHMKNLEDVFDCGDISAMKKMGHTMKGALLNLGLNSLAKLAQKIEFYPEEITNIEDCKLAIASLRKEIDCIQLA